MKSFKPTGNEVLRATIGGLLLLVTLATLMLNIGHGEKAPVLTMVGGGLVLTGLLPARRPERQDLPAVIGGTVGAVLAILAAFYWLSDAVKDTGGNPFQTLAVVLLGATVLLVFLFFVATIIWGANALNRPIDPGFIKQRRGIVNRVRRRLSELVDEIRYARPVSSDGVRFAQYDSEIFLLLLHSWSMLANQWRTTYAWEEHENLIGNYLVERLVRTAQIAISKHPHQCKYGECAQALADDASLFLQRVNIIGDFDPLPDACPECHESKPSHKANCVAAICWRCKYPTPPIKAGSTNTAAIIPQCHIPPICFPRGEQIGTDSQVLPSTTAALLLSVAIIDVGSGFVALWPDVFVSSGTRTARNRQSGLESI